MQDAGSQVLEREKTSSKSGMLEAETILVISRSGRWF